MSVVRKTMRAGGRMDAEMSSLIGRIYSGVHDTRSFDLGLSGLLARTGARIGLVVATGVAETEFVGMRGHGAIDGKLEDRLADYRAEELWRIDPTFVFLSQNPTARFFDTALHRDRETHLADPFLPWNRDLTGANHWMACHSVREPGSSFGIALHPRHGPDPFGERERTEFQLIFEHFERAQWLAIRPPDVEHDAEPVVLIDPQRRIRSMSASAEALLARRDGLVSRGNMLTTSDPREARAFDRLIHSALNAVARGGIGGQMLVARPSGARALAVVVEPLPDQAELASFARGALVRIVDPEQEASPDAVARWRDLWSLTPAETRLATTLVAHAFDLRLAADLLGVTYATVRTQLAALFAKTGTRSQPELMRLLSRIPG